MEEYLATDVYQQNPGALRQEVEALGRKVFDALMADGSRREQYRRLAEQPEQLEIVVQSASCEFFRIPWELLKAGDAPYVAMAARSFTRFITGTGSGFPNGFASKRVTQLRVLLVISRPAGLEDIAYRTIGRPLLDDPDLPALPLTIDVLRPPTFESRKNKLRAASQRGEPYHIVHFDGHAEVPDRLGAGPAPTVSGNATGEPQLASLIFEQPLVGLRDPVAAVDFVKALRELGISIVVLNACRSGAAQVEASAGIATSLMGAGATAVVAMQYLIYADAAAQFMKVFYQAVLSGQSLFQAVSRGAGLPARPKPSPERQGTSAAR